MDPSLEILLVLVGLLGSAFFSGTETGLISLNRVRLRHEVERQNRRAIILHGFLENTERLLGTTLVGTNLANVLVAVFTSALFARLWSMHGWGAELVATLAAAALALIFGEIAPKTLFRHYPHRLCSTFAPVLNAAAWLFAPLVALLGGLMRTIFRLGRNPDQPRSFFVTREELKHLAREGEAGGTLTSEERQMIHGVFDFPYKTVFDIMLPLSRAVTVDPASKIGELLELSERTGFARFPVLRGPEVIGIVNVYEILFAGAANGDAPIEPFIRQPHFLRSVERIDRVLPRLRASRLPLHFVVDPDGKPLGLVTIEDIVEEIVGDVEG